MEYSKKVPVVRRGRGDKLSLRGIKGKEGVGEGVELSEGRWFVDLDI